MSVPVYKRKESKLEVFIKARTLATYTIQICANDKTFPKEFRTLITGEIVKEAKDIFLNICEANKVRVIDASSAEERLGLQQKANRGCDRLLWLIELAFKIFHLRAKRVEYWARLTLETQELIRKWHATDKKRYADVLESN